jgi:hypothetical protein
MDEDTIAAEEEWQVHQIQRNTMSAQQAADQYENEWIELRNTTT